MTQLKLMLARAVRSQATFQLRKIKGSRFGYNRTLRCKANTKTNREKTKGRFNASKMMFEYRVLSFEQVHKQNLNKAVEL